MTHARGIAIRSTLVCLALSVAGPAAARGVSPYLPLKLSPEIERDIERVLLLGNQAVMTRPIPAARVLNALPEACKRDEKLCMRVRKYLRRYMDVVNVVHAEVDLATTDGVAHAVPNEHGLSSDSPWQASVAAYGRLGDYVLVSGGAVASDDDVVPTGSMLSLGMHYMQLDVGYRDHWFSPMTDSSMLISSNAPTMPSATLSNYQPITGLGLSYELFVAQMSESSNIAYQGGTTTGKPILSGIHIAMEPVSGWALGANRIVQSGGGERGGRSASDYLHALWQPHDYDNTSASLTSDAEFGNQAAAWTSRIVFPGRTPFSVYYEYAGEDTSFSGNYRLGNAALSVGIDFPKLFESFDLTIELSEWQNGWYVHGIYGDGLTNEGRVIGHWFGDERQIRDGIGGQSAMARIGWRPSFGGVGELRYRTLQNEHYSGVDYRRAHEATLSYAYPWLGALVGLEAYGGRDVFGDDYARLSAFARFGADYHGSGTYADTDENDRDYARVEYFVDAGGSASRVRIELTDGKPKYVTDYGYAPHFAFGVRRPVSEHSDLGTRVEFDTIEGTDLIAVRALDYRYRFGGHFAATLFAGAARYDLATPAYGYYLGAGVQWRNVFKNFDLSMDVRYGDKIARDKLLADDPPALPRDDVFYDVMGATLYATYRL